MADNIIASPVAMAQTESPQAPYNNVNHGLEFPVYTAGSAPFQQVDAPLQLLPEIHGKPSKPVYSEGQTDHGPRPKPDQAVPLPPVKPHDLGKAPQAKASDAKLPDIRALADKTLHSIALADGSALAKPSRDAQALVRQFLAETAHLADKDKPSALRKLAPGFDKAITEADTAYVQVEKQSEPGIKTAKESYITANSSYNQAYDDTLAAAKGLPAPEQKKAALLLAHVAIEGAKVPSKDELSKAFKDQPQFLDSVLQLAQDQKSLFAAAKSLDQANKPVLDAAVEQDRTRLAYERTAQSVGNQALAKSIDAERILVATQTKDLTDPPEELRKVIKI